MKIVAIVIGVLLLLVGLGGIPRFLLHAKEEEGPELSGRATCIGCETVAGAWLIFYGIRGLVRDANDPYRHTEPYDPSKHRKPPPPESSAEQSDSPEPRDPA